MRQPGHSGTRSIHAGKILLLEEVETEPWIIDHSLSHLRNAGKLKEVSGVVIGECKTAFHGSSIPGFIPT